MSFCHSVEKHVSLSLCRKRTQVILSKNTSLCLSVEKEPKSFFRKTRLYVSLSKKLCLYVKIVDFFNTF